MRESTQTIWRTVVVAGAMIGTPACKSKPAPTTPAPASNTAPAPDPTQANTKPDPTKTTTDPGDPCNAPDSPNRPRGADDDGGGGVGRGFILS